MACRDTPTLSDPPEDEVSGKNIVVVNAAGDTVMITAPLDPSVLVWDGTNLYWANGDDTRQVNLPELTKFSSDFTGLAIFRNGRLLSLVNDTETIKTLQCVNGVWSMVSKSASESFPETGNGVLRRSVAGVIDYLGQKGVVYIDSTGEATRIEVGANGTVLEVVGGVPQFTTPSGGDIASGAGTTGLETVRGKSTDDITVTITIPSFDVSDGASSVTLVNINVSVVITNPVGPLGHDTGGSESASKWYYVYIISDGKLSPLVSAVISDDPVSPDLSATEFTGPEYTFYGFAGLFRNNASSNIVKFYQKGRKFWIDLDYGIMCNAVGSLTTSFAPVQEAVGSGALALSAIIPPMTTSIDGIAIGLTSASQYIITGWDGTSLGTFGVGSQFMRDSGAVNGSGNFYGIPIFNPSNPRIAHRATAAKTDRTVRIHSYEI